VGKAVDAEHHMKGHEVTESTVVKEGGGGEGGEEEEGEKSVMDWSSSSSL